MVPNTDSPPSQSSVGKERATLAEPGVKERDPETQSKENRAA